MLESWTDGGISDDFVNYFQNEWINTLPNWYTGASDYGTTNNGVEATNNSIKNHITLRKRLSVKEFMEKLIKAVEYYSECPDFENPAVKMVIKEKEFEAAYAFKELKVC